MLERHPRHRDSLIALASFERDRGRLVEAERHATVAAALDPADGGVAALVQQIRTLRRQRQP